MKILMVTTGGTISCVKTQNGYAPQYGGEVFKEKLNLEGINLQILDLFSLDSTNVSTNHWKEIATALFENKNDYDAFIVTHGTDTMAYTSSALSYALPNFNKPVVITGSQLALDSEKTDAFDNLNLALQWCKVGYTGVVIAFGTRVINGINAVKTDTRDFNAFSSVNALYLATMQNGKLTINCEQNKKTTLQPSLNLNINDKVVAFKLTPAFDSKIIRLACESGYTSIIIECFGLGGIPSNNHTLIEDLQYAIQKGVKVVLKSQCLNGDTDLSVYEVGQKALEIGCVSAGDKTFEQTVVSQMFCK